MASYTLHMSLRIPLTRSVIIRTVVKKLRRKLKFTMPNCMHITDNSHNSLLARETAIVCKINQDYVILTSSNSQFLLILVKSSPETAAMRSFTSEQNIVMGSTFLLNNEHNKLAELE
ncbi:hypothetical protein [Nitrosomonas sp. Nm33]|uniref:hypothetical protein n=1 Tax=Nitrosomonas sp. Nm33 TaxID=133724 RepID=UPI000B80C0A0